jgi:outer membrane protein insertion porin family
MFPVSGSIQIRIMNSRILPPAVCVASVVSAMAVATVARAQEKGPKVVEIEVQYAGAATVAKERLLANMRTRVGQPYSEQTVEEDIRNLYATGNVLNVRIFGEPKGEGVKVIVVLQAKARVTAVEIQGVQQVKLSRVRDKLGVKQGDTAGEAAMEADRQKILEYYSSKGFTDVQVSYKLETNEKLGTARVIYTVSEGSKTAIKSIRFEGNSKISSSELSDVVKTRKYRPVLSPIFKTGRLNLDQISEDAAAIREYYQNRGYSDVQVSEPVVNRSNGKVDIVFQIVEGAPYKVGAITFRGGKLFPESEFQRVTKLRPGATFSPAAVQADVKALQDLYGARGYVDFQAGVRPTTGGDHVTNITYSMEEGSPAYVGRINITGNTRTKDKVVRRELALAPGEIFNTVRLDASKARLNNLNYFSKVDLYPSETGNPAERDLNVVLEEKRTGSLNFGAGFSSIDSVLGFVEVTQGNFDAGRWPNFTGGGQKFRSRLQYGARRKDAVIGLTEPYFLDQKLSLGGELFYHDNAYGSDLYSSQSMGFELVARKPITEFSFGRLGYRIEQVDLHSVDLSSSPPDAIKELQQAGALVKSQIFTGITYDTRDSLFLTRKGERLDLSTFVTGGPLAGDIQIYGWNAEASKYFLFKWDTILTLNAQAGVVNDWGGKSDKENVRMPIFDRLFLGGANDLRGFRFRRVGGRGNVADKTTGEPLGGRTLARATVEYTAPVIDKVRAAVFYDAGFINEQAFDFSGSGYNSDAGLGLRLDLPIGPVRIDYGIPLKNDQYLSSKRGRFQFNVGYQF